MKNKKDIYTVNVIGDGLLRHQSLQDDKKNAKELALQYAIDHHEEYAEDGYLKVLVFKEGNSYGDDFVTVNFGDSLEEIKKDIAMAFEEK
ncbi:hypothetical protein [Bacillus toyonensis]|uniref:hypothetical protein n=1 Tax=Bacillus toyonensis TaxID=155322 RepID=UPI002E1A3246|nr:hypothetical protein [Bacillus toyonensis]